MNAYLKDISPSLLVPPSVNIPQAITIARRYPITGTTNKTIIAINIGLNRVLQNQAQQNEHHVFRIRVAPTSQILL